MIQTYLISKATMCISSFAVGAIGRVVEIKNCTNHIRLLEAITCSSEIPSLPLPPPPPTDMRLSYFKTDAYTAEIELIRKNETYCFQIPKTNPNGKTNKKGE